MHENHLKETQRQLELTLYMKTSPDEKSEKPLCEVRIKNSCYIKLLWHTVRRHYWHRHFHLDYIYIHT